MLRILKYTHQRTFNESEGPFFLREKKELPNLPQEKQIFYVSAHRAET